MLFDKKTGKCQYEIERTGEGKIIKVNCIGCPKFPSIENDAVCMRQTLSKLIEIPDAVRIVFSQAQDYDYDFNQTQMLAEIAKIYAMLTKKKEIFSLTLLGSPEYPDVVAPRYSFIKSIIYKMLLEDPISAYVKIKREIRKARIQRDKRINKKLVKFDDNYINALNYVLQLLEKAALIKKVKPQLSGFKVGERDIYSNIFKPAIKPNFMYTKLMAAYPEGGEEIGSYAVADTEVTVFRIPGSVQYLYHMMPPEFRLSEEKFNLVNSARDIMAEHKPTKEEFVEPERMREVFKHVGTDLIAELAAGMKLRLTDEELDELSEILLRYTIGFGLIEILMLDENIQDVTINSPYGTNPMFLVHGRFGNCVTNIYPTATESESWATKLRLISGRPLDEANPILDTEIQLPGASTRVAAVTNPLNPTGIAFAFRRHRSKPWTFPLFIENRMINSLAAGLLSFIIDGTRTLLIAGTRSSGKSSFLGSIMVELMRRYRVITIEDTLELPVPSLRRLGYNIQSLKVSSALGLGQAEVSAENGIRSTLRMGDSSLIIGEVRSSLRGNQEVVVVQNGLTKRVPIKELENANLKLFYLPTLSNEAKMMLKPISGFVKHPKCSKLLKITTKTGRSVTVTPDHSVFTHVNFKIAAISTDQLKPGDPLIIPSKIPSEFNDIGHINLLEVFKDNYRLENAEPYIRKAIKVIGWRKASRICGVADVYHYLLSTQKTRIPISSFLKLMKEAGIEYNIEDLRVKRGTSNSIPVKFPINENIMRLMGYYLAEGNICKDKIQITNSKPKIIEDIKYICRKELGLEVKQRKIKGYGNSIQMFIISKPLLDLFIYLSCGKTSYYKRIPGFVYGLNKRKICSLLKGMYSGDGSISSNKCAGNMIRYFSTSQKLVEDVSYALLSLGIVCRLLERAPKKKGSKMIFIAEIKQRKYIEYFLNNIGFTHKNPEMISKSFPHSKDDSISFDPKEFERHLRLPRKYRHLRKTKQCSKDYLKRITEEVKCSDEIYDFSHGDFFIDKIKTIETINLSAPEHVYDLEIKSTQRFIGGFGGILLHNTEAKALYEAMRVGAAANIVAGTIHAASPYGVFDRVVNDIGVPPTSFKATDIIVITNPVKSAGGLSRVRRVLSISEVRKDWTKDPMEENGFVDLMVYNTETDQLEPTPELINGDSDILKEIAGSVKQWAGKWDAVWDNIQLRAKIKQKMVDYAKAAKNPSILEAEFAVKANDEFHNISENVLQETGGLDSKKILNEFDRWLRKEIRLMSRG
ncbi:Flp pilus assembly complex ATPase component TadA [Candidatus Woesearchaeota archaeon]|nr:Flp pilus assembly complex ATPase component TadA [Candidatus Woesearchaeota archaeon]